MKSCLTLSVFLVALALAAVGVAVATHEASPVTQQQRAAELAYRQARDAQDLAERESSAAWWRQFRQDLTPLAWLALAILTGSLVLGTSGAVGIWLARQWDGRQAEQGRLQPRQGQFSVSLAHADQAALVATAGYWQAQIEGAKQPRLPDDLRTYAPRYIEGRQATPQAAPVITSEPAHLLTSFSAPTFAALLQANAVGDGRLLLGYTPDAPVVGSWKDLYSTAVGGVSGSGKTNTTRFLAAQSAMSGARFCILDPHAGAGEDSLAATLAPLAPSFIADPAADVPTMRAVIKRVSAELDERMRTGRKGPPLVVACDEFTSLMRGPVGDDLAALIERIGQEGRKYGVFALLSGQIWTAERSGGSELRDSLASAFVHRLKPSQARLLVPDIDRAVARLPVGHAYLSRTSGDLLEVAIPLTTAADLEAVAQRMPAPAVGDVAPPPRRPSLAELINPPRPVLRVVRPDEDDGDGVPGRTSTPAPDFEAETEQNEASVLVRTSTPAEDDDPQARRVVELYQQGVSRNSICSIIYGGKTPRTLREVNRALAAAGLLSDQAADGD